MKAIAYKGRKTGRTFYRFELCEEEYHGLRNGDAGACVYCGAEIIGGVEPDAEKYPCEACELEGVYGIEQLLLLGAVSISAAEEMEAV